MRIKGIPGPATKFLLGVLIDLTMRGCRRAETRVTTRVGVLWYSLRGDEDLLWLVLPLLVATVGI